MIKNLLRESWVKTGWNCTNAPSTKTNTQTAYLSMLVYQYARFPLLGQTRLAGVSPWRGCWVLVPVRCNHIHFMILTWVVGHAGAFPAEPAASQPQGTQRHTTIRDHTYTRHAHILTHTQPEGQFRVLEQTHSVVIVSKSFFFSCEITHYFGPCPNQIWYHPTCPVEDKLQSLSVLSGSWKYCFWLCELMMEPVIDFFNFSVTSINTDYVTGRRLTLKLLWWWTPTYFPGLSRSLMSSLRDSEYCFTIESSLFYLISNLIFALLLMGL